MIFFLACRQREFRFTERSYFKTSANNASEEKGGLKSCFKIENAYQSVLRMNYFYPKDLYI